LAPVLTLGAVNLQAEFLRAFAESAGGGAGADATKRDVLWADRDSELLVRVPRTRIALGAGYVFVAISVFTQETGEVEIVVPFAVSRPGESLGLIAATEPTPRGSPIIVDEWGNQLVAAAWGALLRVLTTVAARTGVDDANVPLRPTSFYAGVNGIVITSQARHDFERRIAL
jgi:hypothetical protein